MSSTLFMGRKIPEDRSQMYLDVEVTATVLGETDTQYRIEWMCPDPECHGLNIDTVSKVNVDLSDRWGVNNVYGKYCNSCKRWVPVRLPERS